MSKVKIKNVNEKTIKEKFWVWCAIISMTVYVVWRIFFTVPDHNIYGWVATICGIFLVAAETISMLEGTEHFTRLRRKSIPEKPVLPLDWFPDVDVFIATHNESADLLYKTVNGCKHMRYPDRKKVHIYLCDDSNRPEVAALARKMGVGYFGMEENKLAKAGNLNHALSLTHSPYVATFDADMIPTREFLMETVPYMFLPKLKQLDDGTWAERSEDEVDEDFKMGFIQTPQSFYNPDLFQFNFYSEKRIPNEQDFFFREINVGRNRANAPIYAGSNTLISREALDEVGGIAAGTITEDFETGIKIQAKGYTCYALDKALAHGLAPTDIDSLIRQRVRWGRGCISSLRHVHLLFHPNLKLNTKLSYISCWLYWWTFFRRFIYIISPILFVVFGIPVVICGLWELLLIWQPSYLLYNHALKITSGKLRTQRWSNIVDTVIFPYMILPILLETLFIKEKKFHVTNKERTAGKKSDFQLAVPHILLLVLDGYALFLAVYTSIHTYNYGMAIIIYWLLMNGLSLFMALFFMSGRKNLRANDRFTVEFPAEVDYHGKKYYGVKGDASETGLSLIFSQSAYLPHEKGEEMEIRLKTERYEAVVKGTAVQVSKQEDGSWRYGVKLSELDEENKASYFQMLYDRDHSLAKQMGKSVSIFEDVFLNIHRRAERGTQSRRALPRVDLGLELPTVTGGKVRVVDCNYEFARLEAVDAILLPYEQVKAPGGVMICRQAEGKAGLYQIENWQELLFNGVFDTLFAQADYALPEEKEPAPAKS